MVSADGKPTHGSLATVTVKPNHVALSKKKKDEIIPLLIPQQGKSQDSCILTEDFI